MKVVHKHTEGREVPVSSIPAGVPFGRAGNDHIFIRVKMTGFLLNSSIITDILNRSDVLVVNLNQGTFYSIKGDERVLAVGAELHVTF